MPYMTLKQYNYYHRYYRLCTYAWYKGSMCMHEIILEDLYTELGEYSYNMMPHREAA